MEQSKLKNIIEAALLAVDEPISIERIQAMFDPNLEEVPNRATIKDVVSLLQIDYEGRGIELKEVGNGYRIQVTSEYSEWVNRLWEERPPKYSRALLETLAIIAYRQPVTRGEIEDIRGVSVSTNIVRILLEREWVRVAGHRDVPGRPAVYVTTREFLDYFNLQGLSELPELPELKDLDEITPDLFATQKGQIEGQEAPLLVVAGEADTTQGDAETERVAALVSDEPLAAPQGETAQTDQDQQAIESVEDISTESIADEPPPDFDSIDALNQAFEQERSQPDPETSTAAEAGSESPANQTTDTAEAEEDTSDLQGLA